MTMSISKGKFISFEGIDACGKSTQVKLLLKEMNTSSNKTILVREPGGSTISEEIRDILLNSKLNEMSDRTEALLMTGSRAQLTYEKIISLQIFRDLHIFCSSSLEKFPRTNFTLSLVDFLSPIPNRNLG